MAGYPQIDIVKAIENADIKASQSLIRLVKSGGRPVFGAAHLTAIQSALNNGMQKSGGILVTAHLLEGPDEPVQVVGAAVAAISEQDVDILAIVVRADCRGQGIGRQLLATILNERCGKLQSATCWVDPNHAQMKQLLANAGFVFQRQQAVQRPEYVSDTWQCATKQLDHAVMTQSDVQGNSSADDGNRQMLSLQGDNQASISKSHVLQPLELGLLRQVIDLHRSAMYKNQPVFGSGSKFEGVQGMLEYMATASDETDTYSVVAVATSQDGSRTVVGVITGQYERFDESDTGRGDQDSSQSKLQSFLQLVVLTLVISPSEQQHGIGSMLLGAMSEHALKQGAIKLVTDVATVNEPAVKFFEKNGFKIQPSSCNISSTTQKEKRKSKASNSGFGKRQQADKQRNAAKQLAASVDMVKYLVDKSDSCFASNNATSVPSILASGPRHMSMSALPDTTRLLAQNYHARTAVDLPMPFCHGFRTQTFKPVMKQYNTTRTPRLGRCFL